MSFSKKIMSVVLALIMMVSVVTAVSVSVSADEYYPAYDASKPNMVVGEVKYTGSGDVKIPIYIYNNPGIWGANFQLAYDSNLTYKSIEEASGVLMQNCIANESDGIITIFFDSAVGSNGLSNITTNGALLYVTFTPTAYSVGAYYSVSFTYDGRKSIINAEGKDLDLTFKNGGVSCISKVVAPAKPVIKSAAVSGKNQVKLTWGKVSGATSYKVYRKINSGKWTTLKTVKTTSYTDKTAKAAGTYYYTVAAVNSAGKSANATYKAVKVMSFTAKPVVKTASVGKKYIKVTLKTTVKNASGYQYVVGTNSKITKGKKTVNSTKTKNVKISGLKSKTTYYVKVRAYKKVGSKKVYGAWSTKVYKVKKKTK